MKLFGKKKKIQIKKKLPAEGRDVIKVNPARGFYHVYPFYLDKEKDKDVVAAGFYPNETLALIEICLSEYCRKSLDGEALDMIEEIFCKAEEKGMDIILRICYDLEGKAASKEPANIGTVSGHMDDLAPLLNAHDRHILVIQGVFVGNWGEMHGSRYSTDASITRLYRHLRNIISERIVIGFRKPYFRRLCEGENIALFNDAIMASESDLGTYAEGTRSVELDYQNDEMGTFFNGGEVLCPDSSIDAEVVVDTLYKMHTCYLNSAYDARVLEMWKRMDAPSLSARLSKSLPGEIALSYRQSLFELIDSLLGYRLIVSGFEKDGKDIVLIITNIGFGNMVQDTVLELAVGDRKYDKFVKKGTFYSNRMRSFIFDIEDLAEGTYKVRLSLKREWDSRPLIFANKGADETGVDIGQIIVG